MSLKGTLVYGHLFGIRADELDGRCRTLTLTSWGCNHVCARKVPSRIFLKTNLSMCRRAPHSSVLRIRGGAGPSAVVKYSMSSYKGDASLVSRDRSQPIQPRPSTIVVPLPRILWHIVASLRLLFHSAKNAIVFILAASARVHVEVVVARFRALIHLHIGAATPPHLSTSETLRLAPGEAVNEASVVQRSCLVEILCG